MVCRDGIDFNSEFLNNFLVFVLSKDLVLESD